MHWPSFDEAISAYSKALAQNPALQDAEHNRKLVEKLLKQQKQQKQQKPQEQNQKAQEPQPQGQQEGQNPPYTASEGNPKASPVPPSSRQPQDSDSQKNPGTEGDGTKDSEKTDNSSAAPTAAQKPKASESAQERTGGMSEAELSLEQWLRRIPDDPAGLLRRKFEYEATQHQEPLPKGRAPW